MKYLVLTLASLPAFAHVGRIALKYFNNTIINCDRKFSRY